MNLCHEGSKCHEGRLVKNMYPHGPCTIVKWKSPFVLTCNIRWFVPVFVVLYVILVYFYLYTCTSITSKSNILWVPQLVGLRSHKVVHKRPQLVGLCPRDYSQFIQPLTFLTYIYTCFSYQNCITSSSLHKNHVFVLTPTCRILPDVHHEPQHVTYGHACVRAFVSSGPTA